MLCLNFSKPNVMFLIMTCFGCCPYEISVEFTTLNIYSD